VFKVAAEIIISARRILVRVSSIWPHLAHLIEVARHGGAKLRSTG
jgi:hypothetical protein